MQITTIGLDLAKSIFQVHGVDAHGAKAGPVGSCVIRQSAGFLETSGCDAVPL